MATTRIAFLDTRRTIEVETTLSLRASWGDRVSRAQDGPVVYGSLAGAPHGTRGDLHVEAGQVGDWWSSHPVTVRGFVDGNSTELTDQQRADALATYEAVAAAWRAAVAGDPEIAAAVEGNRRAQDGISEQHAAHYRQWEIDVQSIARKFRRARVQVGEQTIPGKCCVRSTRGKLLGYANVWDGVWLGTVEHI